MFGVLVMMYVSECRSYRTIRETRAAGVRTTSSRINAFRRSYNAFRNTSRRYTAFRTANRRHNASLASRSGQSVCRARDMERTAVMRYAAAVLFFVLVFAGYMIMSTGAAEQTPADAAAGESFRIVSPGETLWEIAAAVKADGMDTRRAVYEIKQRNGLKDGILLAGQRLIIPDWKSQ